MMRRSAVPIAACLVFLSSCAGRDASEGKTLADLPEWALELPAFLPPITRLRRVGNEIWLRREDDRGAWRWLVLDAEGNPIGTFTHPRAVDPRILATDIIRAVETDGLGVPWVVRYRLRR
jgi:hypothetical protein